MLDIEYDDDYDKKDNELVVNFCIKDFIIKQLTLKIDEYSKSTNILHQATLSKHNQLRLLEECEFVQARQ